MIHQQIQSLKQREKVTRDEIQELATELGKVENKVLLTFATRVGKSQTALNLVKDTNSLLVVVPTEYIKKKTWEPLLKDCSFKYKIICWASVKNLKPSDNWESIILDESHTLSENHLKVLKTLGAKKWIGLSATMPYEKGLLWSQLVGKYYHWDISLQQAIDWGILPEPKISVYYVTPDDTIYNQWYEKGNDKNKKNLFLNWEERFKSDPNFNIKIKCTEKKWLEYFEQELNYWKKVMDIKNGNIRDYSLDEIQRIQARTSSIPILGVQRKLMNLGNKRKQFFINVKTAHYKVLSDKLKFENRRYIVFTGSTEQANSLGVLNTVHSLNPDKDAVYQKFLSGEINHVYSVHMLDEGLELGNLDFSVIIQGTLGGKVKGKTEPIQRLGRTLTSVSPKCLILVVKGTKDENFLNEITKLVDPKYIKELKL